MIIAVDRVSLSMTISTITKAAGLFLFLCVSLLLQRVSGSLLLLLLPFVPLSG